jgi:hypothetical protein
MVAVGLVLAHDPRSFVHKIAVLGGNADVQQIHETRSVSHFELPKRGLSLDRHAAGHRKLPRFDA